MIQVVKPTLDKPFFAPDMSPESLTVFLGGTIDMGNSVDWQTKIVKYFENNYSDHDIMFFNPRRDDWDSSWDQSPKPGTKFFDQVTWETQAQSHAHVLVYYFADGSMSPITLMELGRFGNEEDTDVHATSKYDRYGNVALFCKDKDIELVHNMNGIYDFILDAY